MTQLLQGSGMLRDENDRSRLGRGIGSLLPFLVPQALRSQVASKYVLLLVPSAKFQTKNGHSSRAVSDHFPLRQRTSPEATNRSSPAARGEPRNGGAGSRSRAPTASRRPLHGLLVPN